jgi:hypothetical protein
MAWFIARNHSMMGRWIIRRGFQKPSNHPRC